MISSLMGTQEKKEADVVHYSFHSHFFTSIVSNHDHSSSDSDNHFLFFFSCLPLLLLSTAVTIYLASIQTLSVTFDRFYLSLAVASVRKCLSIPKSVCVLSVCVCLRCGAVFMRLFCILFLQILAQQNGLQTRHWRSA